MKERVMAAWRRLAGGAGRVRLWLVLGVAGMLLIGLSEWLPRREESDRTEPTLTVSAEQIEQALEERVMSLLTAVEGVGECRVMVTLESTARQVYAASTATDGTGATSEEVLTVATEEGPAGLLLTTLQPSVKGVAVVCAGGDDPAVCQRVTQVVATAFHISERRVCVVSQQ